MMSNGQKCSHFQRCVGNLRDQAVHVKNHSILSKWRHSLLFMDRCKQQHIVVDKFLMVDAYSRIHACMHC